MDKTALVARIDSLLATKLPNEKGENTVSTIFEVQQATLTILKAVYGADSPQMATLKDAEARITPWGSDHATGLTKAVWPALQGTLRSLKSEIDLGLVGDLERRVSGEILGDMLAMAKEALREQTTGAKNVAAVLVAASFEDTIRKIGSTLAGVNDRPELSEVFRALKAANVLVGAPLTIGLSYLKFRNDALHADWQHLDEAAVSSCLSFVEGLILKHLS